MSCINIRYLAFYVLQNFIKLARIYTTIVQRLRIRLGAASFTESINIADGKAFVVENTWDDITLHENNSQFTIVRDIVRYAGTPMPQYMHPIMMPVRAAVAACVAELDRAVIVNIWKIVHNASDWAQLWRTTRDEDTCAKHMLTRFLRRAGIPAQMQTIGALAHK